ASRDRAQPSFLELRNHLAKRHSKKMREMLELRRAKAVNVDVRIFFADVAKQFEVPVERQAGMVPSLHQDLNTARRGKFVQFFVELLPAQDVMVLDLFR